MLSLNEVLLWIHSGWVFTFSFVFHGFYIKSITSSQSRNSKCSRFDETVRRTLWQKSRSRLEIFGLDLSSMVGVITSGVDAIRWRADKEYYLQRKNPFNFMSRLSHGEDRSLGDRDSTYPWIKGCQVLFCRASSSCLYQKAFHSCSSRYGWGLPEWQ